MSQLKFYKYATWGLLLLNVAILAFFLLTKPGPPPRTGSGNFQAEVIKMFNLNEQQKNTFRALAEQHNQQMTTINDEQQDLLRPYFESLANTSVSIDEADALRQFQQLEREKIVVTHEHFKALKSILDEEQLPHFEQFIRRYIDVIQGRRGKRQPRPENGR